MSVRILTGDSRTILPTLPEQSVQCCVTSPPYFGLRDYGVDGQIGLESTVEAYVAEMVGVFREVRRVLRDDGVLWLNLGDSYNAARDGWHPGGGKQATLARHQGISRSGANVAGLKPKDMIGIPWRVAFALQADGWYLRSDCIWHKPNPMPESVRDRPTKAHEYVFLLTKSERYFWDAEAVKERASDKTHWTYPQPDKAARAGQTTNGTGDSTLRAYSNGTRNLRTVWTIATKPFSGTKLLADYVGPDGKPYIASPDCPLHWQLAGSRIQSTAEGDAPPTAGPSRNPGTGAGLDAGCASALSATPNRDSSRDRRATTDCLTPQNAQTRTPENTPDYRTSNGHHEPISGEGISSRTSRTSARDSGPLDMSDSLDLSCVETATHHSTQSHKMDPGFATTEPCTASAQNPAHTGGTLGLPGFDAAFPRMSESNNEPSGSDGLLPSGTAGRSSRKPFAPESLASSEPSKCNCTIAHVDHFATFPPDLAERCIKSGSRSGDTVLDPFGGAGTTGLVADRLGRDAVLIELNPQYAAMTRNRVIGDAPLLAQTGD